MMMMMVMVMEQVERECLYQTLLYLRQWCLAAAAAVVVVVVVAAAAAAESGVRVRARARVRGGVGVDLIDCLLCYCYRAMLKRRLLVLWHRILHVESCCCVYVSWRICCPIRRFLVRIYYGAAYWLAFGGCDLIVRHVLCWYLLLHFHRLMMMWRLLLLSY